MSNHKNKSNRKKQLSYKNKLSHRPSTAFKSRLGFTLIEVLVALVVFASLSLAGYQVVNQVQRSNQQSQEKTQRLEEVQRAMIIMDSDFRQMVARSFKGNENADKNALLYSGDQYLDSESEGILFVRLGWQNPQQAFPRGEIVKVGYRITKENLERIWWRYPDTPTGQEPLHKVVLPQVETMSFRFYDGKAWQSTWVNAQKTPAAVEMTLTLKDYGEIRRVYLTPEGEQSGVANGPDSTQDSFNSDDAVTQ
ncbi:MAG: type II secretion system minor pseudopilin GspJ [Vibrio sp.]